MFGALPEDRWWGLDYRRRLCFDLPFCQGSAYPFALAEVLVMLANNWSPPPLCLLAIEATEPAEEAIKRSITSTN